MPKRVSIQQHNPTEPQHNPSLPNITPLSQEDLLHKNLNIPGRIIQNKTTSPAPIPRVYLNRAASVQTSNTSLQNLGITIPQQVHHLTAQQMIFIATSNPRSFKKNLLRIFSQLPHLHPQPPSTFNTHGLLSAFQRWLLLSSSPSLPASKTPGLSHDNFQPIDNPGPTKRACLPC